MKELQTLINKAVKASNAYHKAISALDEYCDRTYGKSPSDIDADEIIDGVYGAAGQASGMKAADFDAIMKGR